MRIAINTLAMKEQLYGVGNYIKYLVASLSKLDSSNEYILFASEQNAHHLQALGSNFSIEVVPSNRLLRLFWEQTVLPIKLKQRRVDAFHGPTFVAPLLKSCRQVVSILDMTFHLTPERHSTLKRAYFRAMIPQMTRRCERIIAISESTKRDLVSLLKVDEERISVTHLGVDQRFRPVTAAKELARMRQKYRLPDKYILYVGMIEPRKNLEFLVDAYESASVHAGFDLVLAGKLGWAYKPLLEKVAKSAVRDKIRFPGYVADEDLPAVISMASVFVYPSLYEGFGLPVLEAMACGTPVITSNVSSLPEVVGDAAILIDPFRTQSLVSALEAVLRDDHCQASLAQAGLRRAQLFTWERTAQKTLRVYEDLMEL